MQYEASTSHTYNTTVTWDISDKEMMQLQYYPIKYHSFVTLLQSCIPYLPSDIQLMTTINENDDDDNDKNDNKIPDWVRSNTKHIYEIEQCRWLLLASYPGMKGCQVKMLLGYSCLEHRVEITAAHVTLAKTRLAEEFAFFGK